MIAIPLILLSINGNCMEFCYIYVVWWFFETKAFCALPKKAKISKLQRLKIGLGMSNIEFYYMAVSQKDWKQSNRRI